MPSKPAARKRELDPYTVRWFMRRLRAKEKGHAVDELATRGAGDRNNDRAYSLWLSFGIFADLIHHEAKRLMRKTATKRPRTKPKRVAAGKGER